MQRWSGEFGVDPLLVFSVIRTESSFEPDAESAAGARGLMQMTSDTFDWVKSKIASDEMITFDDLLDPATSIRFGCYFLSSCLERYNDDVPTAAAAYHSGWGTVDGLLEKEEYSADGVVLDVFPHRNMRHYVSKITTAYEKYQNIYGSY